MIYKSFVITESSPEKLSAAIDAFFEGHPEVTMVSANQSQSSGVDGVSITFTLIYKEAGRKNQISGFGAARD